MKNTITILAITLLCAIEALGQNTLAKIKFEDAEKAYNEQRYSQCIESLAEAETLLGQTAPNISYLRIMASVKLWEQNPLSDYDETLKLSTLMKDYLLEYDIPGLEAKYKEVYEASKLVPSTRDEYEKMKAIKQREIELELKKLAVIDSMMPMVQVKGGNFFNNGKSNQISDFQIGKFEVTQDIWVQIMGYNPSYHQKWPYAPFRNLPREQRTVARCTRCPVESVTIEEIQTFINKLNELTGRRYKLPASIQWEYAANGGEHQSNLKYSGSKKWKEVAWCVGNSSENYASQIISDADAPIYGSHPVGQKYPNRLGTHDMSGNVWEVCIDGNSYIRRGGCFEYYPAASVITWTTSYEGKHKSTGFRLIIEQ